MRPHRHQLRFRGFPLLILAAVLGMGLIVKLLWNAILPSLLGINHINYWQSVGLLVLSRILFGGFGGGRPGRGAGWRGRWKQEYGDDSAGGNPFRNKWMNMNQEERTRFREEMRKRCGNFRKKDE
jgi:hypothetical protein